MTIERIVRGVAGFMILASLTLAITHDINWLILTLFVGLNLLQSAVTDWCPLMGILHRLGVRKAGDTPADD
ncbi:YgaP family membrane protein [Salidesulfovibrio brasiliensis]|uniref:YgaP family membrane protein n=1 Tax=Salidesulfovibrio brasiliensis TaxID=221711 RepID=UPI0006D23883|nr:DUF2892 domain-containing protein [Salidesulfovibrio brasiliensis]